MPVVCADHCNEQNNMNNYKKRSLQSLMEAGSCTGKVSHVSMREAKHAAKSMNIKTCEPVGAYQCPFCRLFHIGHRKNKKRLEAEKKIRHFEAQSRNRKRREQELV